MRLVRNQCHLPELPDGCVLTIGNFDGLHIGHQAMLERLNKHAAALGLPSALMTFEPMPRELFTPENAPARLSSLREKIEDARDFGVELFVRLAFSRELATQSALTFMQDLLLERLNARYVLVGEDFHFARNQEGDVSTLKAFGVEHRIEVEAMPAVEIAGERVSSTRVRVALASGDVTLARQLLGRSYRICGRVARGQQLGRTLGFPTVNIRIHRRVALCYGVYAVRVRLPDGTGYYGAASLGVRPAVGGQDCLLEVYLLDFDSNLYNQRIDVFFEAFIRPEADFDSLESLTHQMHEDVAKVRAVFK